MMEEQFERGCTSPLLYMEAWKGSLRYHTFSQAKSVLDPGVLFCGKKRTAYRRAGYAYGLSVRI